MSALPLVAEGLVLRVEGATLVDGVSLRLEAGELLGVVGPNGAGKTSLLRLLAGDLAPTAGRVLLGGVPLDAMRSLALARSRALLPQHTLLQFAFRALDVVLMGRYPHRESSGEQDRAVAEAAMSGTDTAHLAARFYPTLSGGEQTRVSLARVLAQETPLIMLDEPTVSLDLRHQELVMSLLRGLVREGAGVIVVLHDLNLAARYADRLALLVAGEIKALGTAQQVLGPETIASAYGLPVDVLPHPLVENVPLVLPSRKPK